MTGAVYAVAPPAQIPASFSALAKAASPAVVNIATEQVVRGPAGYGFGMPRGGPGGDRDDPSEFFNRFFGQGRPPMTQKMHSLGSGFVIDPKGYILTNFHVVQNASKITVRLTNKKEYPAKVVGQDPKTDLALILIKTDTPLPALPLGDSDKIQVGDWVVAIGNPFGLDHTVTAGIVSAKGRVIGAGPYDDFIQTDASINPGNSGGPLLNLSGEVVGINSAITSEGQGIGFAIPARLAKEVVEQLKTKGSVERGWLGVMIQTLTPELAKSFKMEGKTGALVADVDPDGPAKAHLKSGDVITAFNGQAVKESTELPVLVAAAPVGSEAKVTYVREGRTQTVTIKLGRLPEEKVADQGEEAEEGPAALGLQVQDVTPNLAARLRVKPGSGVVVTAIDPNGPTYQAGLRTGDVIAEVNRQATPNIGKFKSAAGAVKSGDTVLFLVKRQGRTLFFTIELG
jgi:serine protease Do